MLKVVRTTLCLIAIVLVGCASEVTTPQPYPGPYPGPSGRTPRPGAVRFQIERPVRADDTLVKGSGPAGIPVVIVNVTMLGDELGGGVIGADNRFAISVPPLPSSIRIGLTVDDLTGTNYTIEEFYGDEYKGEGALMVPMVGYFQDTVLVQSR